MYRSSQFDGAWRGASLQWHHSSAAALDPSDLSRYVPHKGISSGRRYAGLFFSRAVQISHIDYNVGTRPFPGAA